MTCGTAGLTMLRIASPSGMWAASSMKYTVGCREASLRRPAGKASYLELCAHSMQRLEPAFLLRLASGYSAFSQSGWLRYRMFAYSMVVLRFCQLPKPKHWSSFVGHDPRFAAIHDISALSELVSLAIVFLQDGRPRSPLERLY